MTANLFAYFMLIIWPAISLLLYQRLSITEATVWTLLGAHLLLPAGLVIDFPFIPPLDKFTISSLMALVGCLWVSRRKVRLWDWKNSKLTKILLFVSICSPFITGFLNTDSLTYGVTLIKGMTSYDALSNLVNQSIAFIPFVIGRRLFRKPEDILTIFVPLAIALMWYSPLMLFEVRMSPQLNNWIYGYHAHSFVQQMRAGGFRPTVFVTHGLIMAYLTMMALTVTTIMWKLDIRLRKLRPAWVVSFFWILLILCKSMASILYAIFLGIMIKLASPRKQVQVACLLTVLGLGYPLLRLFDLFPVDTVMNAAQSISAERADSLNFRFDNENMLLDHARKRFLFGWGMWGRNRVYDAQLGYDLSVTDGFWIITVGVMGFIGYVALMALLMVPVFRTAKALRYCNSANDKLILSGAAMLIAIKIIDLLPNGFLFPIDWLLAGALLGNAEALTALNPPHNFVGTSKASQR